MNHAQPEWENREKPERSSRSFFRYLFRLILYSWEPKGFFVCTTKWTVYVRGE